MHSRPGLSDSQSECELVRVAGLAEDITERKQIRTGNVDKAIEVGIDAYETKPVSYERLMKKIAALC